MLKSSSNLLIFLTPSEKQNTRPIAEVVCGVIGSLILHFALTLTGPSRAIALMGPNLFLG
jgi:hypothetical protein